MRVSVRKCLIAVRWLSGCRMACWPSAGKEDEKRISLRAKLFASSPSVKGENHEFFARLRGRYTYRGQQGKGRRRVTTYFWAFLSAFSLLSPGMFFFSSSTDSSKAVPSLSGANMRLGPKGIGVAAGMALVRSV